MTQEEIGQIVSAFISKNFLFDESKKLGEDDSLLGSGAIDSTGILELITFLESTFRLKFDDKELVAENFDSIARIKSFVASKLNHRTQ